MSLCVGGKRETLNVMSNNKHAIVSSPKLANKIDVMKLSIAIETTSPIDAARGVAILSGFTLYLFDSRITAIKTKSEKIN